MLVVVEVDVVGRISLQFILKPSRLTSLSLLKVMVTALLVDLYIDWPITVPDFVNMTVPALVSLACKK